MPTGSVSEAVAGLVHGPARTGHVAARTRHAVYVATGHPELPALAVTAPEAIRVPNAVVLARPHPDWTGVRAGAPVRFGEGRVELGGARCVAAEGSWAPPRAQGLLAAPVWAVRRAELERALPATDAVLDPADLRAALYADDTARIIAAGRALVGRGPGLTPSGDDILCGALLARHATGRPVGALAAAVAGAEARTPLVSAALLRHAVRGECVPQAADVIRGLAAEWPLDLAPLLAVGHHSGADLARGIAAGLSCAHAPDTAEPPPGEAGAQPGVPRGCRRPRS
ncbi:DUF2877 domain-containing protein [Streptomyces sp. NPDC050658]|uniref:DUF2877 domain-containing protein n=1 Tax=unclassified Streptomyces TaxID=2593676 RepID=UPI0034361A20